MEYDHMAELGLTQDTQLVCSDHFFLTRSNNLRDLCARTIRNGAKLYDVLTRSDYVNAFALSKDNTNAGNADKAIIPFLKAYGVTDEMVYEFSKANTKMTIGAASTMRYLFDQMPTFIVTGSYEHDVMHLSDLVSVPMTNISCTSFSFDAIQIPRLDAKLIREMGVKLSEAKIDDEMYSVTGSEYLNKSDSAIIDSVETVNKELDKMEFMAEIKKTQNIASNEKAYALLELCRKNSIEMGSTAMIGSDNADFQAMDLVSDSDGLSISFNGSEYAVRGSNVAVMADRPIIAAVLVNEFYNGGIESVYTMIDNWSRDKLKKLPCADRNLMNEFLAEYPKKLPKVARVTQKNVKTIIEDSYNYRKKFVQ